MSDDYEKNRPFGKPEGIEKRLAYWARQFSMDQKYPWVGLGVIDDLKCACRMLGGDPDKLYPDMRNSKELTNPLKDAVANAQTVIEPKSAPVQEYNL